MKASDLDAFKSMPFLFWAKSDDGVYLWGNDTINTFGGGTVVGKTDRELPWADTAQALVDHDNSVLDSGKPGFMHEVVHESASGHATLSVCKFPGEFEGKRCTFGVSFVTDD